jgi:hypothetical protein
MRRTARSRGDNVDAVSLGEAGHELSYDFDDGVDFGVGDELERAYRFQGHVSFQVKRRLGEQVAEHAAVGQCGGEGSRAHVRVAGAPCRGYPESPAGKKTNSQS